MKSIREAPPQFKARLAGVFYLLTILAGGFTAFAAAEPALSLAANLIASASYVAVTVLFYDLFLPVDRTLSRIAACFSLVGCALGALAPFHLFPAVINHLAFFGVYCILIGCLIFRSTFLPRILGVLMAFGGVGWLTFARPHFAGYLAPFNMIPGLVGEGALTLWLLIAGVNVAKWEQKVHKAV